MGQKGANDVLGKGSQAVSSRFDDKCVTRLGEMTSLSASWHVGKLTCYRPFPSIMDDDHGRDGIMWELCCR